MPLLLLITSEVAKRLGVDLSVHHERCARSRLKPSESTDLNLGFD